MDIMIFCAQSDTSGACVIKTYYSRNYRSYDRKICFCVKNIDYGHMTVIHIFS